MKSHQSLFVTLLGFIFILCSCSEDHDCEEGVITLPNSVNLLSGIEYQENLLDCRLSRIQTFTFPGFEGGVFNGSQGTQITIPVQSILDQNGNPIDQDVTLELIEMYQPGEIIACQLSTDGLSTTNIPEPLLSEGIYYLNLTVADPDITITLASPISVFSPSSNEGLILNQFNSLSCQEVDCEVLWEFNPNAEVFPDTIEGSAGETVTGYRTFVTILGWISKARFNPDGSDRTIIYNKATAQYDGSNSDTFFLYKNESVGVSKFARYNDALDVFSEQFGQIPMGSDGTFILTTVQEGDYRFSTQARQVEDGTIGLTTQTTDSPEAQFITQINSLQ
ncbi:hypothetical protein EAX61_13345 [Dokdonia sinensis]|uniref:Uncharacterized protein n=1 Tax=Dokdonia sinensis TaxID=2479847 RepID=A0A3M0G6Q6_9FLAO|nr:hypothetical protein [Dokdonia sinensis]RMB56779.1 hypothetical protein EAX61_13345 [Dokdonia sinensis]